VLNRCSFPVLSLAQENQSKTNPNYIVKSENSETGKRRRTKKRRRRRKIFVVPRPGASLSHLVKIALSSPKMTPPPSRTHPFA
jgi:hypothetical protein